jgi:hypothetical protein
VCLCVCIGFSRLRCDRFICSCDDVNSTSDCIKCEEFLDRVRQRKIPRYAAVCLEYYLWIQNKVKIYYVFCHFYPSRFTVCLQLECLALDFLNSSIEMPEKFSHSLNRNFLLLPPSIPPQSGIIQSYQHTVPLFTWSWEIPRKLLTISGTEIQTETYQITKETDMAPRCFVSLWKIKLLRYFSYKMNMLVPTEPANSYPASQ